jgi:hypothetical protein
MTNEEWARASVRALLARLTVQALAALKRMR